MDSTSSSKVEEVSEIEEMAKVAKRASYKLSASTLDQRNSILFKLRDLLTSQRNEIIKANKQDLANAEEGIKSGTYSETLLKRLELSDSKFESLIKGINDVIKFDDPLNQIQKSTDLDNHLLLHKISCPIGVLCIIYEARPEAAVQIFSLAIKSGNSLILKGGKEAVLSNTALHQIFCQAVKDGCDAFEGCVQLVTTHDEINKLLSLDKYIDLVIPRGSGNLVRNIKANTRIPVLGHAEGLCCMYFDKNLNIKKAKNCLFDAKTDYVAACNSLDTLLINEDALYLVAEIVSDLITQKKVEVRADEKSLKFIKGAIASDPSDYSTEFLDYKLAVKTVKDVYEAIEHINEFSSHHTDSIITEDNLTAEIFLKNVNSAGVYLNASTRFADGFRYGFGAEVGVSTNKIHARGPVGMEGLLIYKYVLLGDGQGAGDFGTGKKHFIHADVKPKDKYFKMPK